MLYRRYSGILAYNENGFEDRVTDDFFDCMDDEIRFGLIVEEHRAYVFRLRLRLVDRFNKDGFGIYLFFIYDFGLLL